jgi:hypothetical protein
VIFWSEIAMFWIDASTSILLSKKGGAHRVNGAIPPALPAHAPSSWRFRP